MKLFNIDWADFFARLPVWEELSLKARLAMSQMRGNEACPTAEFDGHDQRLVDAGYLCRCTNGQRVRLDKAAGPFVRVIRAMLRHDLQNATKRGAFEAYLTEHFTHEEQRARCPHYHHCYDYAEELTRQATSIGWLNAFLEKSPGNSESLHSVPSWLAANDGRTSILPKVQTMVRRFLEWSELVPFHKLPARLPEFSTGILGAAVHYGIDQLLLFPTMRQEEMIPRLGLWPTIAARLHRPKLSPPAVVRPKEVFHQPYLMEDMTTVLVTAVAKPIRLRVNDGALFAKAQQELEASLLTLPPWLAVTDRPSTPPRTDSAVTWLRAMGLIRTTGGDGLWLEPTQRGHRWLAGNAKQRLKDILDHLKHPQAKELAKDEGSEDYLADEEDDLGSSSTVYDEMAHVEFVPQTIRFEVRGVPVSLQPLLAAACASLPNDAFVALPDFIRWQMQEKNPFLTLWPPDKRPTVHQHWSWQTPTDEDLENLWANLLVDFFRLRLLPLGGARLGITGKPGSACLTLTDIGRYLLDMAEDFDHGLDHGTQHGVIVQPNFDVVFLAPSPLAEATIARFAERQAKGLGAILKLTKKSILAAAAGGMTAAEVLETLEQVSAKPLPANVRREIQGWFDQCRRINVWPTVLIHCPDADTATRVVATFGSRVTPIHETLLELRGSSLETELVRRLQSMGIFVDRVAMSTQGARGAEKTSRRGSRRRRR